MADAIVSFVLVPWAAVAILSLIMIVPMGNMIENEEDARLFRGILAHFLFVPLVLPYYFVKGAVKLIRGV